MLAAFLLPVFTAACGPKTEIVTQVVVKPVPPEPVPPQMLATLPPPKCPAERVEYEVPRLEQRARCFERDSAITRAALAQLQGAVKEREDRGKELANRQ
mgnify:CR=1 FL=1